MHSVEERPEAPRWSGDVTAVWAVRVLLAAALSRALRAGLSRNDIGELLHELAQQGEPDA
jgi:hypothetical protein